MSRGKFFLVHFILFSSCLPIIFVIAILVCCHSRSMEISDLRFHSSSKCKLSQWTPRRIHNYFNEYWCHKRCANNFELFIEIHRSRQAIQCQSVDGEQYFRPKNHPSQETTWYFTMCSHKHWRKNGLDLTNVKTEMKQLFHSLSSMLDYQNKILDLQSTTNSLVKQSKTNEKRKLIADLLNPLSEVSWDSRLPDTTLFSKVS